MFLFAYSACDRDLSNAEVNPDEVVMPTPKSGGFIGDSLRSVLLEILDEYGADSAIVHWETVYNKNNRRDVWIAKLSQAIDSLSGDELYFVRDIRDSLDNQDFDWTTSIAEDEDENWIDINDTLFATLDTVDIIAIFYDLNDYSPARATDASGSQDRPDCSCNQSSAISCFPVFYCNVAECEPSQRGCGFLWRYSCDGECGFAGG